MAEKQLIIKLETSCSLAPQRSAEELCGVLKGGLPGDRPQNECTQPVHTHIKG